MHGIFPDVVFRACCLHGGRGKFDSFSLFNRGAKRKCGPRLHWLDKRVTTSAVYFVRNSGPRFLFAAAGRESNEKKIAIMVKRLSPPPPLDFNFSKPSSTKGMKYKMKSWEIKKKLSADKNRTDTQLRALALFSPTSPELRTNLIRSLSLFFSFNPSSSFALTRKHRGARQWTPKDEIFRRETKSSILEREKEEILLLFDRLPNDLINRTCRN